MSEGFISIDDELAIPLSEVAFETSRSSGPGGQHVNKTESRVTLVFDVAASAALTDNARRLIAERCANRMSKRGELRLSAQSHRSQKANRELAIERFTELLRQALTVVEERRPTRPSAAVKRRRLDAKRKQSTKKALRQTPIPE